MSTIAANDPPAGAAASRPPVRVGGPVGWIRDNLFGSVLDSILTVAAVALLVVLVPPLLRTLLIDAVWSGDDRTACLAAETGACWAYVRAYFGYFMYGFYPGAERWRVDLTMVMGVLGAAWLLWPNAPHKALGSAFFFGLFPVLGFILLTGTSTLALPPVPTNLWGGLLVTLVIASVGIVVSLPLGILIALGRRSRLPIMRFVCTLYVELVRGVPLITVLFMANFMLPLFLPQGWQPDSLLRVLVGVALFAAAYMAEVVRGGLQAIPKGQYEGAAAMGLGYWQSMILIILPQALRIVIPGIVNTFIGLFKDTSLVSIVGIFDLLRAVETSFANPAWATPVTRFTGYIFAAFVYFVFCFGMSRYSLSVERRLAAAQKR